jgi:hypothetical protein
MMTSSVSLTGNCGSADKSDLATGDETYFWSLWLVKKLCDGLKACFCKFLYRFAVASSSSSSFGTATALV